MKKNTQDTGKEGEGIAKDYMQKKGYKLINQNYRYKKAEIDLIFQKEGLLIFVEVKFRSNDAFGLPEETVSNDQQDRIVAAAEHYIVETDWQEDIRFDIIAILATKKEFDIQHFEDAFY